MADAIAGVSVPEIEVRRAAAELGAVGMERRYLVRIGPFRGAPKQARAEGTRLRWRERIAREMQEPDGLERTARGEGDRLSHLAGVDWRQILVERSGDRTAGSWWLPRTVVRLLDAAEHTETQWLRTVRAREADASATQPASRHGQPPVAVMPLPDHRYQYCTPR
ncbi:hypothetical protein [Streptomyces sp. NBC_01462]|uniref:hypothetical protein n=1 Tax=Streptomyces sp. NBC_01462 TaxID=2903876 RepID=UPI002E324C5E|nr:hypothetical protein [Streptomyces sp. NBC_01462]